MSNIQAMKSFEFLNVFNEIDHCNLECDGLTTIISSLLSEISVPHHVYIGCAATGEGIGITPHLWIEIGDVVIDYRLRMWLGDDLSVPHGVFKKSDYEHITYDGVLRDSYTGRHPFALINCMTAGFDYDSLAVKLLNEMKGDVVSLGR